LLIATCILASERHRWRLFWISAVAIMLVKEDLIPVVSALGLYLWLRGERQRGAILIAVSLVSFVVVVGWLIPRLNDAGQFMFAGAYGGVFDRPWMLPLTLITPARKVQTALLWLAPFGFLSLLSPLSILLVPFALSRFLSESPTHWGTTFHYSAPLAPIVAMAAADGLARLTTTWPAGRHRRTVVAASAMMVILSMILPGQQPFWDLFKARHYTLTPIHHTGRAVMRMIPDDASVTAQSPIVPHLTHRRHIYMLQANAPDTEYVVAARQLGAWPLTPEAVVAEINQRQQRGYAVAFDDGNWVLLRRGTKDQPD
jgi:uncharacterized membrane protein